MTSPVDVGYRNRFESLANGATLEIVLPAGQDVDPAAFIRQPPSTVAQLPVRRSLFFDEEATIFLLLKTHLEGSELRDALADVELNLAAHATEAVVQGSGNAAIASGKHDLNALTFNAANTTDVVSKDGTTFVIWRTTLHLSRPRARIQRPAIYLTCNLNVREEVARKSRRLEKDALQSFEPLPANVLEPLRSDPALKDSLIHLPASRIIKVAPKPPGLQGPPKPIRGATKRAFPAVPAVFIRMKYSTLPDSIIASVHLETAHVVTGTVNIDCVDLRVFGVDVQKLSPTGPFSSRADDETVVLYRLLHPDRWRETAVNQSVEVAINATAISDGSGSRLAITWQTNFESQSPRQTSTCRWSRPISLSSTTAARLSAISSQRPTSSDGISKPIDGDSSIIFQFTGPALVSVGREFRLHVQCSNRSKRSRRFALAVQQLRNPRPSSQFALAATDGASIARTFNAPPLEHPQPHSVLDLNADVRIGPLPAGACFETTLLFRALIVGVLDLGTIRVIDLDSRQTVDVREMPDVIAVHAEST